MHPNELVLHNFYTAFSSKDVEKMIAHYHPDVEFSDPAFGTLKGNKAKAMWRMLCENSKDLKIEFCDLAADERQGKAHWEAYYVFSGTGRNVHNVIEATFQFQDGMIFRHIDQFDLRSWATQALGFKGKVLGGTDFFRKRLQVKTNRLLQEFMEFS